MNTLAAFAMGEANRGKPLMVFDWHKAAKLIKEKNPKEVNAGLSGDWDYTGGNIWENGTPNMEDYTYLSSTWARPEIEIDGESIDDCWIYQKDCPENWGSDTKWPQSALDILNS